LASRIEKRLLNLVGRASKRFDLLEADDRVMVCLSGGKDSYSMMVLLEKIRRKAPFPFTLVAVNLDQGHPDFEQSIVRNWCVDQGYEHKMLAADTYRIVREKIPEGKTYCSMCSRLRRGILYNAAQELGATKISLGHHADDFIETLMLNMLFAGSVKSMAVRLVSDDKRNITIRPLVYCAESDIEVLAKEKGFPIVLCGFCSSQEQLQRQQIKRLIAELNGKNPNVRGNLFAALQHVIPSHLLDRTLTRL
jgi:tRNA 2-thiocytidine biosynthesis protein TtcA